MKMTRVIGLTGGIATGKTTVSGMFQRLGAKVIDADTAARAVVEPGSPVLAEIAAAFGADMIQPDGSLHRQALGRLIFTHAPARQKLNELTHPPIRAWMQSRLDEAVNAGTHPVVILDIPLLFETSLFLDQFKETVLVYIPAHLQLQRLMQRDGLDAEQARERVAAQMPIEQKRSLATWVIDNSGTLDSTAGQVTKLWKELVADAHRPHRP